MLKTLNFQKACLNLSQNSLKECVLLEYTNYIICVTQKLMMRFDTIPQTCVNLSKPER